MRSTTTANLSNLRQRQQQSNACNLVFDRHRFFAIFMWLTLPFSRRERFFAYCFKSHVQGTRNRHGFARCIDCRHMEPKSTLFYPRPRKRIYVSIGNRFNTEQIRRAETFRILSSTLGSSKSEGFGSKPTANNAPHNKSTITVSGQTTSIDASPLHQVHYFIPTIRVPDAAVHTLLQNPGFRNYLPLERFQDVHPRVKMVRDDDEDVAHKLVLLDPDKVSYNQAGSDTVDGKTDNLQYTMSNLPTALLNILATHQATPGPIVPLSIKHTQLPTAQMLSFLLPSQALPPPTSYEVIGHLMHLNLRATHLPYKYIIGDALLRKFAPTISTIVNKVGEVGGQYRTYEMELLAGEPEYNVTVIESGISLQFDARNVYWSSRLAGERARMMQEEILPKQVVADAFCGVGALCIAAAKKKGCIVRANDLNPYAVECCRSNAMKNGIKDVSEVDIKGMGAFTVTCDDARDFIRSLGNRRQWGDDILEQQWNEETTHRPNLKVHSPRLLSKKRGSFPPMELPHHLIMNYPLDAPAFLDQLRWWPTNSKVETKVHVYTFARADPSTGRDAETVAIDCIAQNLLPQGGAIEITYNRRSELDALGCNVRAQEIRDVAPQKMVIYVVFKATRLLIKRMQGIF